DLNAVATANQLCNQYGMDTISCGATLAWAFNAYEEEMLTLADTGGLALNWGNAEAMVKLTAMIGRREGFGDLLAEGSARAAAKIGKGSEDLVVTGKKMEYPAHMPQVKRSLGLVYSVNPYGADHQASEHDGTYEGGFKFYKERLGQIGFTEKQERYSLTDEKVRFALVTEQLYSALNSSSVCQFVYGPSWHLYDTAQLVQAINAVTGWDVTIAELIRVGERSLNLQRAFNTREAFTGEDDKLPKKLSKALQGGRSDGFSFTPEQLEIAKDAYFAYAGWDVTTGTPTREKLRELEMEWVAEELGL
ncbi:MAG: aldehyde ferredoxin oxidoreductase C-terminal domain-containing protein, partial [Anaerolineae bacterium]